ncbi:MAG TPA: CobD/CbiB family protein [Rhodoferax sp.]|nr:CobD/CbiB family protein [Rhodoferax sp.]
MSFFAVLLALLIEQARPLGPDNPVYASLRAWAGWVTRNFDTGKTRHGWAAWSLATLLPSLLALGIHWLLVWGLSWPFAVLWNVAVLYVTLGFRQFSHYFTDLRDALDEGNEARARALLAQWQRVDAEDVPRSEIVRHVIEYSVLAAHRHVFGVLAWYCVLAALGLGPTGAVFYRMSEFVSRYWKYKDNLQNQAASPALQGAAAAAWMVVDWLPARFTALSFAVVGSFEDAIDGWRNYAQRFPGDNDGVILAATAGAVDVRLGGEALRASFASAPSPGFEATVDQEDSVSTPGREPEVAHLRSIVGLVWRSVVMWMVLLALLTLARLLG